MGFVQSGKTTNFTAVMAKAADRGYKLFIVLSGIHNTLRRQTQIRLVKDLVDANPGHWHQVTSETRDFTPSPNPKAFFASKDQSLLLVVLALGIEPTQALVLSQVLSFGIPFALVPLVLLTRRRDLMGDLVNRSLTTVGAGISALVIIALNAFLLIEVLVTGSAG